MGDHETSKRLPTFLIIGAPKCGTTSLSRYLGAHPDVFVTTPKEPRFFTEHWGRGVGWYQSLFDGAGSAVARGEGTVGYGSTAERPQLPERIRRVVPEVKLVYVVRDPVERLRSHFAFAVHCGEEEQRFDVAVRESRYFVNASRYGFNMDAYLEHFPRDQLLVISSDDLRTNREATVRQVLQFIDVDPEQSIDNLDQEFLRTETLRLRGKWSDRALHAAGRTPLHFLPSPLKRRLHGAFQRRLTYPEISPELEQELWEVFTPDLSRLREIVGADLHLWGRA